MEVRRVRRVRDDITSVPQDPAQDKTERVMHDDIHLNQNFHTFHNQSLSLILLRKRLFLQLIHEQKSSQNNVYLHLADCLMFMSSPGSDTAFWRGPDGRNMKDFEHLKE